MGDSKEFNANPRELQEEEMTHSVASTSQLKKTGSIHCDWSRESWNGLRKEYDDGSKKLLSQNTKLGFNHLKGSNEPKYLFSGSCH